ncbi:MAG: hypothetical protein ACK4N4_01235 [Burkholderiales bacterium]
MLMALFAFAPASADTGMPVKKAGIAAHDTVSDSHGLECASFSGDGQRLYCHLKSANAEATGPSRPPDDGEAVLVAYPAASATHGAETLPALRVDRIPAAAPPAYILFGSFRS